MAKQKYTFYRAHPRVQELGEMVNPHTGQVTKPPSRTKQEFVRECDINNIIKAYSTTGLLNHVSARAATGTYADLPDSYDFQESLNTIKAAEQAFMTLPAKVRDRFGQDPAKFLVFMEKAENQEEAIKLGLAKRLPDPPKADPESALEPTKTPTRAPRSTGGDGGTPPSGGAS